MTAKRLIVAVVLLAACAAPALAQTAEAVACETEVNRRKADWASSAHSWLETTIELQARELQLSRCRMRASTGEQKLHQAENFGRVLLTGEGIHPVIGTIAAGNGFAGGVVLMHEWADEKRPLRFSGDAHTRLSMNRSWVAGAMVDVVGSSPSLSNRHIHAIADASYTHITQLSYFGPGLGSAGDETRFGLNLALGRFSLVLPAGRGFEVFGQASALHSTPFASPDSGVPSIEARFSNISAPGLGEATTYAVLGGGVGWRYPEDEVLTGYSATLHAAIRRYQEMAGHPYSFTRSNVTWDNQYTPEAAVDIGTFSARLSLSASVAGSTDRVPFYLMSTLGGADVNGDNSLRSYRDYRFRGPHTLVAQFEYAHTLYDPLGVFAFYDLGSVAAQFGDVAQDLKHSVGVGLTVRLGGAIFAQIYYAWGGAEGSRFNVSGNSNPIDINRVVRSAF
jgi:hypothetical protein